jgi:predicted RNA-binding Zn-ribbon protein involved in translation (DUF1610 family)
MAFVSPSGLYQHSLSHTHFKCSTCGEYFETYRERHEHKAICAKYACRQCGVKGPKEEEESHKTECNLSYLFEGSSRRKQKRSPEEFLKAANTLQLYLENNKIEISGQAELFRPLWDAQSPKLFLIDTEFARDFLCEICVMTIEGEVVVDTLVNHQTSTQNIYDQVENHMDRGIIDKMYGTEREKYTPGLTMEDIAKVLIDKGFGTDSILIEWSRSHCDYYLLQALLERVGVGHMMPPRSNSWLILYDWKKVVQKSKADLECRLSLLFLALQLDEKSLVQDAHRARPDTLMLLNMVRLYFGWATNYKPQTKHQVTEYFRKVISADVTAMVEGIDESD